MTVSIWTQQKSNSSQSTSTSNKESFQYGEHLACVWYDDNKNCLKWYYGVVDGMDGNNVLVSYLKITDKGGLKWLFPDEAEIHSTNTDQILLRHIQVSYSMTAMIRCEIPCETLEKIQLMFTRFEK